MVSGGIRHPEVRRRWMRLAMADLDTPRGLLAGKANTDRIVASDQLKIGVGGELIGVTHGRRWAELGGHAASGGPRLASEQFVESGDHRATSRTRRGEGRRDERTGTGIAAESAG